LKTRPSPLNVSVANWYSRGDREHDKAAAVLFPSEIAQRGRMRDHSAAQSRSVTVTIEGQSERVTVQQALLLRLRDEAMRGEVWACKLLQKVIDAIPEGPTEYDCIERQVRFFRSRAMFGLIAEESKREKADQNPEPTETGNGA
jgi:hypothetical protein